MNHDRHFNRRGQHTAEYAVVFAIVIAAAVGMQPLVKRAIQARVRDATAAMVGVTSGKAIAGVTLGTTGQYEPYYANSAADVNRLGNTKETRAADGTTARAERARNVRAKDGFDNTEGTPQLPDDNAWVNSEF